MNWQDYLALTIFTAAAVYVAWRAYQALFGQTNSGCGSACGSCRAADSSPSGQTTLLSIEGAPAEPASGILDRSH